MSSSNTTSSSPAKHPLVAWDCVKVKIQSQNAPVATHELSLAGQLQDTDGNPSLNLLQDAVLELGSENSSGGGLDLKLSLSYLDSEGDLVPLTSQDEWDSAMEQRSKSLTATKALLVFAQVLEGKTRIVTVPSASSSPSRPMNGSPSVNDNANINHPSHMFQRLARIEELLLAQQSTRTSKTNDASENDPTSGTMTPTRSGKDYTALVKNERNRLTTKLNKVKQMSGSQGKSINNAASGSSHSRALSPARSVVSVSSVNTQTNHNATNTGNHTIDAWSSQQDKKLEGFLASMTRERQEERDQLLESRNKEQQALSEAHEKLQSSIQLAYEKQQATLEGKLKLHEEKVTQVVNERLEKMEQHRLVAQARDSVAATEALEKATKGLVCSIQNHLQQWEQTLQKQQSNEKHSSEASSSSMASLELAVKELSTWVQKQLLHLEHNNLQQQQKSAPLPPPTSDSHSDSRTAEITQALSTMVSERLDGLQEHLENIINQRVGDLSQSIQSQSLRQMSMQQRRLSMDSTDSRLSAAAGNNNIDVKATKRALIAVVDDRLAVFQRHIDQALQQLTQNHQPVTSASSAVNGMDLSKVSKLIKTSQDKILGNQKQYASALRQTVIRLHDETRKHATSFAPAVPPTGISAKKAGDWEAAKQVILSSHDELRKSYEENMTEQKNYLVECIELSQQAILNRFTNSDISNAGVEDRVAAEVERIQVQATAAILDRVDQAMARRQRWSSSPDIDAEERTETTGATTRSVLSGPEADGGAGEDMEELVLGAMEKLEEAMVANCEHIQAQATAAILDRVDASQKAAEDKVDHTQGVLLNKMMKSNAILVETVGSGNAAIVDTVENNQATLEAKLSAAHSILQALQSKAKQQPVQVKQARQTNMGVSRGVQSDHTRYRSQVEESELSEPLNDMDESRHGELRILYDLDRSRNSLTTRRNDLDDSRMSLHSTRGMPIPRQPSPKSPKRTKAGNLSVQRFLEMDTRAHRLEQAYECIKFNRPLPEDAQRASFAFGESDEFAEGTKFEA